jgi:hypothetical protein
MAEQNNHYAFFNRFQTMFYTSITEFSKYTYFEIKNNSFVLLNNLMKGYPHLAVEILDIYSPHIKAIESPAIIFALQRKFVNSFSRPRVPQHVYFKSLKPKAQPKSKTKEKVLNKDLINFDNDVSFEIKTLLRIDEKTYQYLKYSENIQKIGREILGEMIKKEEQKILKANKRKSSIIQ